MYVFRSMLKISGIEIQKNEDMLCRAGENRSFLSSMKGRRVQLIGTILRHDSLINRIIEKKLDGREHKGRQHLEFIVLLLINKES